MWDSEMVLLLRHVIDDTEEPVKYTDDRLMKLLLVAGQFVQGENAFDTTYTIKVEDLTIKPDPTVTKDDINRNDAFINLSVLKAACLLASSGLLKTSAGNILVREGNYQFDSRGKVDGRKVAAQTWCSAYEEARWDYVSKTREPGIAIIGPYRSHMYGAYGLTCNDRIIR